MFYKILLCKIEQWTIEQKLNQCNGNKSKILGNEVIYNNKSFKKKTSSISKGHSNQQQDEKLVKPQVKKKRRVPKSPPTEFHWNIIPSNNQNMNYSEPEITTMKATAIHNDSDTGDDELLAEIKENLSALAQKAVSEKHIRNQIKNADLDIIQLKSDFSRYLKQLDVVKISCKAFKESSVISTIAKLYFSLY